MMKTRVRMKLTKKTSSVSRISDRSLPLDLPPAELALGGLRTRFRGAVRPGRFAQGLPFALAGALLLLPAATLIAVLPATAAAEQHAPVERVVDGKVVGKTETAISGAVVYLKDSRSLTMKTYITDDAGHFHFGQLSQNTDYELWAVSNGTRSKSRTISSFDDKSGYNFTLKIDTAK
jgi:hypothetical protein